MEYRVSLAFAVPEETLVGEATLYVSAWDGADLLYTSRPWRTEIAITPMTIEDNVYPYAIAAVRAAADRCVADLLEKFGRGEVLLMHEAAGHKKM